MSRRPITIILAALALALAGCTKQPVPSPKGPGPEPEEEPKPQYYVKIGGEPSSWEGTYLIVDEASSNAFVALSPTTSPSTAKVEVIGGGLILSTPEVDRYAVSAVKDGGTHVHGGGLEAYDIVNSENHYIFFSSSELRYMNDNMRNGNHYCHTLAYKDGGVQMMSAQMTESSTQYYLGYSGGKFTYAKGSTGNRVQLYRLKGEPERPQPANEESYNLESTNLSAFLDEAEKSYTDGNWTTVSTVAKYKGSGEGYDVPTPVTLEWSGGSGSMKTVSIYNSPQCNQLETSITTAASKGIIYNLIPGRRYWYTVTTASGANVASGTFATEGRRRMLRISTTVNKNNANNCRDFGGLKTVDGKTLKYGKAFRGSNMSACTAEELAYITGYMNVGADIDLRLNNGTDHGTNAFPVFDQSEILYSYAGYNSWADLSNPTKIKKTFTDIISTISSGKAVYIHCKVGADRTGYVCMLMEAVLGVSPKDCSIDYELTSLSCVGVRSRTGTNDYYFVSGMNYILNYPKGTSFKEKAENILLDAGITPAQISSLRAAMLE